MLTIFIMYSNDRRRALDATIACLEKMPLYGECQKLLVVDGEAKFIPQGWLSIEVPRTKRGFCWANMWEAGVSNAAFDKVLYLDSDRLLPTVLLQRMSEAIVDGVFVFTSNHYMLKKVLPPVALQEFLKSDDPVDLVRPPFLGNVVLDRRRELPKHRFGKNVMSGCTGFTKRTYGKAGGVDPWYCGHGAFADTDFHLAAHRAGCKFVDLGLRELHYPHHKLSDSGNPHTRIALQRMGLDNFVYYCRKWGISQKFAYNLACLIGIPKADTYVKGKWRALG